MTSTTPTRGRHQRGWLPTRPTPVPGDVLACLHELGIPITRVVGEEAEGRCVMHYERTGKHDQHPSWSCNTESGVYNCFSCQWRGPFVQLVRDALDISWDDAVEWVRQRGGIDHVNKLLGRGKYVHELDGETEADPVTEADLALWGLPPQEARKKRGILASSCEKYGVLWDSSRDMWITPIRDRQGKLLGWQEKNERYFRNRPWSVEKSKTLFGFHLFRGGTAVLLESPLDCLRLDSVGVAGAVSSYGAGVSELQMQMLFDRAERIVVAMDNDRDGWKSAKLLKERYRGMGRRLAFYNYQDLAAEEVKDPGEQSGAEIRYGVEHALSPLRVRFRLVA